MSPPPPPPPPLAQVNTFDPLLSMSNTHHHTVKFLEAEISNIELAPQRVHALLRSAPP